ncbi:hypothetical protein ABK040_011076 [Willaertia magna]
MTNQFNFLLVACILAFLVVANSFTSGQTTAPATVTSKIIGSYSTADTGSRGSCLGPNAEPYFIVGWGIYRVNLTNPAAPTTYRWKLFGTVSIQGIVYYDGFFYVSQNFAGNIVKINPNNPDSVTNYITGIDRPENMDIDYNLKRLVVTYGQKTKVGYIDLTATGTPQLVPINNADPVTGLWVVQVDQKTSDIFTDGGGAIQRFKYNKQSNTYTRSVFYTFSYAYLEMKMVNNYLYIRRNGFNSARTLSFIDVRLTPNLLTAFVMPGTYDWIGGFLYIPSSRKFYAVQESFNAAPTPYYGFMEITGANNPCWACDCQLPNMTCRDCGIYQYCNVPKGNCLMDDVCNCTTGWKSNLLDCSTHSCELSNTCSNNKGWCIGPNQCVCQSGWKGDSICSSISCELVNNCTSAAKGTCSAPNVCTCSDGWKGSLDCSIHSCELKNNCNGHGTCIGPNQCSCEAGWLASDNCGTPSCELKNGCNGHGSCDSPNTCTCNSGWKANAECSQHSCDAVNGCSGNGVCTGPNTCECDTYHSGASCDQPTCLLIPYYNPFPARCPSGKEIPRKNTLVFYYEGTKIILPKDSTTTLGTTSTGGVYGSYLKSGVSATLASALGVDNTFSIVGFAKRDTPLNANEAVNVVTFSLGSGKSLSVSLVGSSDASKALLQVVYSVSGNQNAVITGTFTTNNAALNTWTGFSIVRSASSVILYVNYLKVDSTIVDPDSLLAMSLPFSEVTGHTIGGSVDVDELMVFDYALSPVDVPSVITLYLGEHCGWTPDVIGGPKPVVSSTYDAVSKLYTVEVGLFTNDLPAQTTHYQLQLIKSMSSIPNQCNTADVSSPPFTFTDLGCVKKYVYVFDKNVLQQDPFSAAVSEDGNGLVYTTHVLGSYSVNTDQCRLYQFVSRIQFKAELVAAETEFLSIDNLAKLSISRLYVENNKFKVEGTVTSIFDSINDLHDFALDKKTGSSLSFTHTSTPASCGNAICYNLVFTSAIDVTDSLDGTYELTMLMDEKVTNDQTVILSARTVKFVVPIQYTVPTEVAAVTGADITSSITIYDITTHDNRPSISYGAADEVLLGNALDVLVSVPTGFKFVPSEALVCCVPSGSAFPSTKGCSSPDNLYTAKANLISGKSTLGNVQLATGIASLHSKTASPREYFLSFVISERLPTLPTTAQTCRVAIESSFASTGGARTISKFTSYKVSTQSLLTIAPTPSIFESATTVIAMGVSAASGFVIAATCFSVLALLIVCFRSSASSTKAVTSATVSTSIAN